MSARYHSARLPISRRQLARMASAAHSGAPLGLVLGTGSDAVEIEVILTPKQMENLNGGAKRIKFSAAQLKKMKGAGVFSDLGAVATPLAEEGISAGLNAVAPGLGEVAGPILGSVVGPLIKTIGNELDYAVSKKPDFKQLSKNRTQSKSRAKAYAEATPEQQAQQFQQFSSTMSRAPKFVSRGVPKSQADFNALQARNAGLETSADKLKAENKAAFMAKLNEGSGKRGGYRAMTPAQKKKVSGGALGRQAADYIRAELMKRAKN